MTSMPASRSARAMIFAPRSCPSRPGLATTTRIFWVVLGADMADGRVDSMCPGTTAGPRGAPRSCSRRRRLGDLQLQRHARVDLADDRVGTLRVELLQHDALGAHLTDRALLRALGDHDVV